MKQVQGISRVLVVLALFGLASVAQASPIFTFASFQVFGPGMALVNVAVSGAYANGNGGANPNPCGSGVTNCLFLVSGNSGANLNNRTINSVATWNEVSTLVGLGPDKLFNTADDSKPAVNSVFGFDPTQIGGNFVAPTLQNPIFPAEFRMALRSTTPITTELLANCTVANPACLQHFNTGYIDFRLTAAELATLNAQDPRTVGTAGRLLHVDITQLQSNSGGTYGGLQGTRNSTSNVGFQGDTETGTDIFVFSSDYLDFGTQDRSALSWSATVINPCITRYSGNPAACTSGASATANYLHTANFSGLTGSFGANPEPISNYTNPVPEPQTWIFGLTGSALILASVLMKKRSSVKG